MALTAEQVLAICQKYTQDTIHGAGAVAGKPCQIQSKTEITGGTRITFLWEDNAGTQHTTIMDVMDGAKGDPGDNGVSVTVDIEAIAGGHKITFTDSEGPHEVEIMDGAKGDAGDAGEDGVSPAITVKTSTESTYILHIVTADDEFDTPNLKGGSSGSVDELTNEQVDALLALL